MTFRPQTKETRWESKRYTLWIRQQFCCLTGAFPPSVNHHEQKKGHGGKGTKAGDERQVPLFWTIHDLMEQPGWSRQMVWETYHKDPEEVIAELHERYFREFGKRPGIDKI